MKIAFFLLLTQALLAQEALKSPPLNTAPILSMNSHNKSVIVIDPKARSQDLIQAFDLLRKDKPSVKMTLRTVDVIYSGVTDMTASANGTLIFIKLPSNQGTKMQIVPIEQVVEINYSF